MANLAKKEIIGTAGNYMIRATLTKDVEIEKGYTMPAGRVVTLKSEQGGFIKVVFFKTKTAAQAALDSWTTYE